MYGSEENLRSFYDQLLHDLKKIIVTRCRKFSRSVAINGKQFHCLVSILSISFSLRMFQEDKGPSEGP